MTLDDQIKSVGREIGLRRNVYPNFVRKGSLTQEKADHELAAMEEVYKTLKALKASPPAAWSKVSEALPPVNVPVLAHWPPSLMAEDCPTCVALFDGRIWHHPDDGDDDYSAPTWWLPIHSPEPKAAEPVASAPVSP